MDKAKLEEVKAQAVKDVVAMFAGKAIRAEAYTASVAKIIDQVVGSTIENVRALHHALQVRAALTTMAAEDKLPVPVESAPRIRAVLNSFAFEDLVGSIALAAYLKAFA